MADKAPSASVPFIISPEALEKCRAVASRILCPHCMGRLLAKVGRGLGNDERGRIIYKELGISNIPEPKDCTICRGLFSELDLFAKVALKKADGWEFKSYLIGTKVDPEIQEKEEALWAEMKFDTQEPIKVELNREIGKRVGALSGLEPDFKAPDITFVIDTRFNTVELNIKSLFIYGRYQKFERGIPQTKWPCRRCRGRGCPYCENTGKMYQTSVEELAGAPVLRAAQGTGHSFHGMGREDIDARMLGSGRPFILEIANPRVRTMDLASLENEINTVNAGKIGVDRLKWTETQEVERIKASRANKRYRVTVSFEFGPDKEKLYKVASNFCALTIHQQTPKRVLHRRADLKRERTVHSFEIIELEGNKAVIEITGESGLYIKELIHGDSGRTKPNFAEELGSNCTVESLDVMGVQDAEENQGE